MVSVILLGRLQQEMTGEERSGVVEDVVKVTCMLAEVYAFGKVRLQTGKESSCV